MSLVQEVSRDLALLETLLKTGGNSFSNPVRGRTPNPPRIPGTIQILPPELIINIFSYLPVEELGNPGRVSKTWTQLARSRILWENFVLKHDPLLHADLLCSDDVARCADWFFIAKTVKDQSHLQANINRVCAQQMTTAHRVIRSYRIIAYCDTISLTLGVTAQLTYKVGQLSYRVGTLCISLIFR